MHALCKISSRLWRPKLRRPDRNSHAQASQPPALSSRKPDLAYPSRLVTPQSSTPHPVRYACLSPRWHDARALYFPAVLNTSA
jgi:hypothetical protein